VDYTVPDKDIIAAVALKEKGQELIFPVYSGMVPKITDKMKKLTLVVNVAGQERKLEYNHKY
jgi:hypothetical protein